MPPIRNPFIAGGPVPPERFIGRKPEISTIMSRLMASTVGSTAIHGEARIGKTSLLHYIQSDINQSEWGLEPKNYTFIYIDCGIFNEASFAEFWQILHTGFKKFSTQENFIYPLNNIEELTNTKKLISRHQRRLQKLKEMNATSGLNTSPEVLNEIEDIEAEIENLQKQSIIEENTTLIVQQLIENLANVQHKLIILLDEFEIIISKSKPLLSILRTFANGANIGLLISTQKPLYALTSNIDLGGGQTFDRPFDHRNLGTLTKKEILTMIDKHLWKTGITFGDDDTQFIWKESAGHPFKAQFTCSRLFERKLFG
ncbi:MAG: ATP-binding protein [Anaerolineae bacterium]|nr:ATP-binding protein [Anaerolineae bacterium]